MNMKHSEELKLKLAKVAAVALHAA